MSYRQPGILKDTNAFAAKEKAISDSAFKPEEEEVVNDVAPDLETTSSTDEQTTPETEVTGIDPTKSAFYKGNNPINNPNYYQPTVSQDVDPVTETASVDPNDIEASLLANLEKQPQK